LGLNYIVLLHYIVLVGNCELDDVTK